MECNVGTEAKISFPADQQQHNDSKEACTPFCNCSCCPASAFYSPLSKIEVSKVNFQSEKFPQFDFAFTSNVSYSIWQPPKLFS
jgi:hypothetical protein